DGLVGRRGWPSRRGFVPERHDARGARATFQAASAIDVSGDLAAVTAPTLVLHRADIEQIPRAVSEELAAALPNGRLRLLAGSSPALFFENTDEVVRAITGFVLEGRPDGGPPRSEERRVGKEGACAWIAGRL